MSTKRPGTAQTAPAVVNTWVGGADVAKRTCSVKDCDRPHMGRDLCSAHWQRLRVGIPLEVPLQLRGVAPERRFWPKVDRSGGSDACWPWTGARMIFGHGSFWLGTRNVPAHRFSYERLVGPIPDGLQLDHLCRNPPCVNPAHLEPVTNRENGRRGMAGALQRSRTHCPQGHPYDEANTYVSRGYRCCKACRANMQRKRRAARCR